MAPTDALKELFATTAVEFLEASASDPLREGEVAAKAEALPEGGYVAITYRTASGRLARLPELLGMRFRLAAIDRLMLRSSLSPWGRFGITPSLEDPSMIVQLGTPAARYSAGRLLPVPRSSIPSLLHAALSHWAGCHPSLGAILVLGRKPRAS